MLVIFLGKKVGLMSKQNKPSILCIGGANIDKKVVLRKEVRFYSSNPATSTISPGGVSRNIGEYLGRLGCNASMMTYLGDDANGKWLEQNSKPYITFHFTYRDPSEKTGSYTAVLDKKGNMVIGVAEM
jgi:pseudouridine kinase